MIVQSVRFSLVLALFQLKSRSRVAETLDSITAPTSKETRKIGLCEGG